LDKPPPRYWLMKMADLLGYVDESVYDRWLERKKSEQMLNSYKMLAADFDRSVSFLYLSCELNNVLKHILIHPSFIKEYGDTSISNIILQLCSLILRYYTTPVRSIVVAIRWLC